MTILIGLGALLLIGFLVNIVAGKRGVAGDVANIIRVVWRILWYIVGFAVIIAILNSAFHFF